MRRLAILPFLCILAACNTTSQEAESPVPATAPAAPLAPGVPPKPQTVAAIKIAAAGKLKDPYSAQYERMLQAKRPNTRGEPTEIVCGYINAKNSFGGYTGPKPFVYFINDKDLITSESASEDIMVPVLKRFCGGLI